MAKRKMSVVTMVGLVAGGLAVILAGAAAAVSMWLPTSGVAGDLQRALSEKLGRKVTVSGVNLTLWPMLGVQARDLTIANIVGGQARNLIEADAIDIGVSPLPLLSGRVEVHNISLLSPKVQLEKLKDGRVNWNLAAVSNTPPTHQPSWLKDLRVERLEISKGLVSYQDGSTGRIQALTDLNLALAVRSLDAPVNAKGDFAWTGHKATFEIGIVHPRALLAGQETPATVILTSAPLNLKLNGSVAPDPGAVAGDVEASGPSVRDLARLAGSPMDPGPGLQAFSVSGHVIRQGHVVQIEHARLGLDHLTASGDLTIDLSQARPLVTGRVSMGALDLNPYLGPEPPLGAAWTKTPIRLDGLKSFDADLSITADKAIFRKYRISNAALAVLVKTGQADIRIQRMNLYGGSGNGRVVAAAVAAGGRFGFSFQLSGVQMKSVLMDAMKVDRLEGTGGVTLNLSATGGNQDQLMRSLAGKASLTVMDGSLRGVDLAAVSRQITSALLGGAVGDNAHTAFSVAGADFVLARGVANTTDLKISGPGVAVGGVGQIDIGGQSLDMAIKPEGAAKVAGRRIDFGAVPFRVHGPWVKPQYEADLKGVAENALRGQLGKLVGGSGTSGGVDLDGILGGLMGTSAKDKGTSTVAPVPAKGPASSDPSTPPPKTKSPKLKDLLGGLMSH